MKKMFPVKLFGLLLLSAIVRSQDGNPIMFFEDLYKLSDQHVFAQHLLSLASRNESQFMSSNCSRHLVQYAKGLIGLELWAMEFFDASEKLPAGMFMINGAGLGSFDQCLELNHKILGDPVRGKYCLGSFHLQDLISKIISKSSPRMLNVENFKITLSWGICLPDSCTPADFQVVTLNLFSYSDLMCQTLESQDTELDGGDYSACVILGFFCVLVVISTIIHYVYNRGSDKYNYFSLMTTVKSISNEEHSEEEIQCLYGIRSITLLFLIITMKVIMYPLSVVANWIEFIKWPILNKESLMFLEGMISIDTFLLVSGMLVSYNYLQRKQKGKKFNIALFYLNRIIRLTPALGITVLICATLMRHYGSGPIWPYIKSMFIVDSCRKYWWSSLLYIQNYVNPGFTDMCVLQTWYLSVDMQLFILSPLLLIPLGRSPKYTIGFTVFLLFCSIVSPFIATWIYDLHALLIFNINSAALDNYMEHYFFPLHTRASSWIIGFIFGYFLFKSKAESNRLVLKKFFSPLVVIILWCLAIGLFSFCIVIGQAYLVLEYKWLANAFHFALVRPAWSVAVAWIIFACEHGYSGPVNAILSSNAFRTMSRLSYSTFLVNVTVLFAISQQTRRGYTFSVFTIVSSMWSDFVWSFIIGFALAVTFEKPFIIGFKDLCGRLERKYKKRSAY